MTRKRSYPTLKVEANAPEDWQFKLLKINNWLKVLQNTLVTNPHSFHLPLFHQIWQSSQP